jgi:hypothetical protein
VAAALLVAAACSDLDELGDGVIALQVTPPASTTIELGDTVRFQARALDVNGDSVAADITWVSADPANVAVADAALGTVTGLLPNTTGRIQAVLGNLRSGFTTISVQPRADTVRLVEPDTVAVAGSENVSPALAVAVESLDPAGPVPGRGVIYTIVSPAIPDTALRPVQFTNGALVDTVVTGTDGVTSPGAQLQRIPERAAPAEVVVEVRVTRLSGAAVPGSGQRFTVQFEAQGALR